MPLVCVSKIYILIICQLILLPIVMPHGVPFASRSSNGPLLAAYSANCLSNMLLYLIVHLHELLNLVYYLDGFASQLYRQIHKMFSRMFFLIWTQILFVLWLYQLLYEYCSFYFVFSSSLDCVFLSSLLNAIVKHVLVWFNSHLSKLKYPLISSLLCFAFQ